MGIGYFKIGIKLEQYAPIFYLFVYLFTYLFIYSFIYLFIYLFVYLFIYFVLFCFGGLHERQILVTEIEKIKMKKIKKGPALSLMKNMSHFQWTCIIVNLIGSKKQ